MDERLCPYCHELKHQRYLTSGWDGLMYIEGRRIRFDTPSSPGHLHGDTVRSKPINFCPMCGRKL